LYSTSMEGLSIDNRSFADAKILASE